MLINKQTGEFPRSQADSWRFRQMKKCMTEDRCEKWGCGKSLTCTLNSFSWVKPSKFKQTWISLALKFSSMVFTVHTEIGNHAFGNQSTP